MDFDDILFEPEQEELLSRLIVAQESLPRPERQDFKYSPSHTRAKGAHSRAYLEKVIDEGGTTSFEGRLIRKKEEIPWNLDHDVIFHPGLPNGSIDTFQADIDALTLYELIQFREKGLFFITPRGYAYNRIENRNRKGQTRRDYNRNLNEVIPIEIQESLARFRTDCPDPNKVAFVMMRFGNTKAHQDIISGIRKALDPLGIIAVRADDKQYHDDLFSNVLTYVYGSGFGIAVFERIETEEFNPNVALEVGYMFALRKSVCLLKDKTLKTLHADLVGKLYRVFDTLRSIETISDELSRWLRDKELG